MKTTEGLTNVTRFWYAAKSDVTGVAVNYSEKTATVTLANGVAWTEIEFVAGKATFEQALDVSGRAGKKFVMKFSGETAFRREDLTVLDNATDEPVVVRIETMDGRVFIAGSTTSPIRMAYRMNTGEHGATVMFEKESTTRAMEEAESGSGA